MSRLFISLLVLSCLIACEKDTSIDNPGNDPNVDPEIEEPADDLNYLTGDSDYIFDQTKLHTFELLIPEDSYDEINSDPTAEEYVEGSLVFEDELVSKVGIRYKGSIGAFVGCVSGNNWSEPSGHKTCTKLSMKVKINWENSNDKFFGLKKLQFHAMNLDRSQMRERLGYWLFREMGVPAPRCVHVKLLINGEYSGVYALTEQIDGRFTKYNYEEGDGNLYKEVWPVDSNGEALAEVDYIRALKTNEDQNPSAALMKGFGDEIELTPKEEMRGVVEKWMDVDEIISYAVVDRVIRVDDGAFHWYCGASVCTNHNYYWYEDDVNGKMHLIPWDMDNSFENIINDANPVTPIKDEWGETTNNCQPFSYGAFLFTQKSAACDKLTAGWVSYEDEYAQKKMDFINGPLASFNADAQLELWENQIRQATTDAIIIHDDAVNLSEWNFAINELRAQLDYARTH